MSDTGTRRKIEIYDQDAAPALHETQVMSMPAIAPEAAQDV